jgi:hypothetical protein
MNKNAGLLAVLAAISAGSVAADSASYIYFPQLAERVLSGESEAFREVLDLSLTTLPGERLEELAEISSRFVRVSPTDFLRGQVGSPTCFGVAFMGPGYVDDPAAKTAERDLRRAALNSVVDSSLADSKRICLSRLGDG